MNQQLCPPTTGRRGRIGRTAIAAVLAGTMIAGTTTTIGLGGGPSIVAAAHADTIDVDAFVAALEALMTRSKSLVQVLEDLGVADADAATVIKQAMSRSTATLTDVLGADATGAATGGVASILKALVEDSDANGLSLDGTALTARFDAFWEDITPEIKAYYEIPKVNNMPALTRQVEANTFLSNIGDQLGPYLKRYSDMYSSPEEAETRLGRLLGDNFNSQLRKTNEITPEGLQTLNQQLDAVRDAGPQIEIELREMYPEATPAQITEMSQGSSADLLDTLSEAGGDLPANAVNQAWTQSLRTWGVNVLGMLANPKVMATGFWAAGAAIVGGIIVWLFKDHVG
jgi:hypothetical protein